MYGHWKMANKRSSNRIPIVFALFQFFSPVFDRFRTFSVVLGSLFLTVFGRPFSHFFAPFACCHLAAAIWIPLKFRFLESHNVALDFSDFLCAPPGLVAHDCGYPLSRYTCRATRVAADFLDFIAFCRCSTSVALHPLKILVSHLPPCAGRCRTEIWV